MAGATVDEGSVVGILTGLSVVVYEFEFFFVGFVLAEDVPIFPEFQSEHFSFRMSRPRIDLIPPALVLPQDQPIQLQQIPTGPTGLVEDHRLVSVVGIVPHALQPALLHRFSDAAGRRRRSIGQEPRHGELHVHVETIGRSGGEAQGIGIVVPMDDVGQKAHSTSASARVVPHPFRPRPRKDVLLTGVAVVVGIVPRHLVPRPLHGLQIQIPHRLARTPRLVPVFVGPSLQNGHLDAFVIFDGAFQQVVEVGRAVPGEAARDAGIVSEALGRAGEALAAVGVVAEAGLGLEGAVIRQAVLVHQRRVEALVAVFGVELVFGVGGVGEEAGDGDN
mmetsp:Transcript_4518/g.9722  ORF Transcript_4518/g.9722 Transcript_4518/m.9722 type:complete len:333 (-) Transcript_4518:774-1772(-)